MNKETQKQLQELYEKLKEEQEFIITRLSYLEEYQEVLERILYDFEWVLRNGK